MTAIDQAFVVGFANVNDTAGGVRVETIEDLLMQKLLWLDKLIDELVKGKKMEKNLRTAG